MPAPPTLEARAERSRLVAEALASARRAHAGQLRGGRPYIEHPLAVAASVAAARGSDVAIAAALMHDVVEEGRLSLDEIRAQLGTDVAGLVAALSEDGSIPAYVERKREHRDRIAACGEPALMIYAADKVANASALARAGGPAPGTGPSLATKLGAWEEDLEMLRRRAPGLPLAEQLEAEVARLRTRGSA